jgi:cation diffusion facilitator CzcD-associated flavoprotein CzcO
MSTSLGYSSLEWQMKGRAMSERHGRAARKSGRRELLEATDEQIDDAVNYADPMALRGLLYQLTGDESVAATKVGSVPGYVGGNLSAGLTDPADVALLRAKAAGFLKSYRDAGAGPAEIGPVGRLPRSLALAGGMEQLPADDVELWIEELGLDLWARGLTWEQPPPPDRLEGFSVIVVGAGMGGLNAAAQLKHAGIGFTLLEKNAGVGGTWYENRYPGAQVDSPSRAYTHIIGVGYDCPSPWCTREENQAYFDWLADSHGVREHIVFETEVVEMTWHEAAAMWEVTAKGPDGQRVYRANAVITAVGLLSRPSLPRIEGMDDFAGQAFHTARWPGNLELGDKRVAVIGTGCSGVQPVPELAKLAAHVTVFQRTPQWLFEHDGYHHRLRHRIQGQRVPVADGGSRPGRPAGTGPVGEGRPRAYIGAMLPGFPNLFLIYGPNMNPYGDLGVVNHQEMVTRFLLDCGKELILPGKSSVDVTERAYWRYNDELDAREKYKIYKDPRASSYYRNEDGRSAVNCPFPGNEMWHRLRRPDFDDLIVT